MIMILWISLVNIKTLKQSSGRMLCFHPSEGFIILDDLAAFAHQMISQ